jgi:CRP-like cAMP-binding protein
MKHLYEIGLTLDKVLSRLESIDAKLLLIPQIEILMYQEGCVTLRALKAFPDGASASEVGRVTNRARATESRRLNELFRQGLILKERNKKRVVFKVRSRVDVDHVAV